MLDLFIVEKPVDKAQNYNKEDFIVKIRHLEPLVKHIGGYQLSTHHGNSLGIAVVVPFCQNGHFNKDLASHDGSISNVINTEALLQKFSFLPHDEKRGQHSHHKVKNRSNILLRRFALKHSLSLPNIKEHKNKS